MAVAVMDVGEMRVRMGSRGVLMRMHVRLVTAPLKVMRVLMMLVVPMPMIVGEGLVSMRMFVPLPDVKPDSDSHEGRRRPEQQRRQFWPQGER